MSIASCPYMAPTPWLIVGALLVLTGTGTYLFVRRVG